MDEASSRGCTGSFVRHLSLAIAAGLCVGLLAPAAGQAWYVFLGGNFRTVVPGQIYRSAQPSATDVENWVAAHGIRTIVNLRGTVPADSWYRTEQAVARRLGVQVVDLGFFSSTPIQPDRLQRLIDALDAAPLPLLLHCHTGADRTGLAAALLLLLRCDSDLPQARHQLNLLYGHSALGSAGWMDRLLDRYEAWLQAHGLIHAPDHLRRWARQEYQPENSL